MSLLKYLAAHRYNFIDGLAIAMVGISYGREHYIDMLLITVIGGFIGGVIYAKWGKDNETPR